MFPKKGKELHRGAQRFGVAEDFAQAIASALKSELGSTHRAVKTVMGWTGASERTVKHWFAGTHCPSAQHLIALARHSDGVMMFILAAADRPSLSIGGQLMHVRSKLSEMIDVIDACRGARPFTGEAETG